LPAIEAEHERVELPEPPAMLVNESVHDRFVELVVITRPTVPAKPFTGETETDEVPAALVLTLTTVGFADIVKSCAWNVTVAE
jgi:hypothetical protein